MYGKLKLQGRVKAFTIMELTVTMMITSIAVTISYTIYRIISQGYQEFNQRNQQLAVIMQLDQVLKQDFNNSGLMFRTTKGIKIENESRNVLYEFSKDMIVRKSSVIDSFSVSVQNKEFKFRDLPVQPASSNEPALIDEMHLMLIFNEHDLDYNYHKEYSSADLIQLNTYASD